MAKRSSGRSSGTGKSTAKSTAKRISATADEATSTSAGEASRQRPAQAKTTPTSTAPTTTAPPQAIPDKTAPAKTAPTTTAPPQAIPDKTAPAKTAPSKAAPSKAAPSKAAPSKAAGARTTGQGNRKSRSRKPPPVVTAKPKPWGWIAAALAVVLFAVGAIGYAVVQAGEQAELADPDNIEGLQRQTFESAQHTAEDVDYEQSPPFGGPHDLAWADCTGTVYSIPIREENAVHSLEHGAVWVTYNPDLPQDQVDVLAGLVEGEGFTMMSPYPGQESPISLQVWGGQLAVDSVTDPRIEQFIVALRQNPGNTPEPGATCDNPTFAQNPIPDPSGL